MQTWELLLERWYQRWTRWVAVVAVYATATVVWRAVTDRTWLDALVFAGLVGVIDVLTQWVAIRARRKAAARDG
ncbi:hypothetical protein ACFQ8O_10345 [Streptomyces coelicoflavus]|uniref:hypothetical protein n=1 Tax=Streptomyces coelicoflavus TaxID=285562 RepID=UPI00369D817E